MTDGAAAVVFFRLVDQFMRGARSIMAPTWELATPPGEFMPRCRSAQSWKWLRRTSQAAGDVQHLMGVLPGRWGAHAPGSSRMLSHQPNICVVRKVT